jgi:ABC-type glycerol-3-phosphate transport system permease component
MPEPLVLAIFQGLASFNAYAWALIFMGKFKQISAGAQLNKISFDQ